MLSSRRFCFLPLFEVLLQGSRQPIKINGCRFLFQKLLLKDFSFVKGRIIITCSIVFTMML